MIREIKLSDKKEVLRISSQIWEGDDYVNNVFDEWVTGDDGLFTGYWENEKLIGFGRMRFLTPTDIWLEALRKDPQTNLRGVGNKIAKYYMEQLKGKKIIVERKYVDFIKNAYFKNEDEDCDNSDE